LRSGSDRYLHTFTQKIARGCPLADYAGTVVVIAQGRACMTRQQMFRAQSGACVRAHSSKVG